MTGSLHAATIPHFLRQLPQIALLIDKAEAWCAESGTSPDELMSARLAEDMWPLSLQFRSCWSHSADAVDSALTGKRDVDFTEPPADFGWLRERNADAIARLEAIIPADLEAVEGGEVNISAGQHRLKFAVPDYLLHFALPNFYFHSSIAFAILRNQGVQIGKADFLGPLPLREND